MVKKKKVGSTGRYGARYGLKIRRRVLGIERLSLKKHKCPYCSRLRVKRLSSGIFECSKCKSKFAGRAYTYDGGV